MMALPSQRRHRGGSTSKFAKIVTLLAAAALLSVLPVWPTIAQAHNVSVFAWVEDGKVHVESKFSGGRHPKNAPIEVYDAQGQKLLEGKTDEQGRFTFDVPAVTDLKIVLLAGMGHRGEWTVRRSEIEPAADGATPGPAPPPEEDMPGAVSQGPPASPTPSGGGLTAAEVERIVEKVVESKMAPIRKTLAEAHQKGPSLSDIIGGIGYILGLVGIATYIGFRKK